MTLHTSARATTWPRDDEEFDWPGEDPRLSPRRRFYATDATCTHVSDRWRRQDRRRLQVQCRAQARFDIRTGEVVDWANFPPGIQLLNAVRGEKALKTYKSSGKWRRARRRTSA